MNDNQHFFSGKLMPQFNPFQADNKELFDMSLKFANGDGVELDYIAAHVCLNIAAIRGCSQSADFRKELALDMSPDEIALAQKEARALLEAIRKNSLN